MPHQDLNRPQIDSRFQQMGGEAVPEGVNAMTVLDASSLFHAIKDSCHGILWHVPRAALIQKEPCTERTIVSPVRTQLAAERVNKFETPA